MSYQYEVLLKNGTVVDPVNHRKGALDVAIANGKVAEVAPGINLSIAQEWFDVKDCYVVPGIIDLHIHASSWWGGRFSHKMMAQAGVTTALDLAGPIESVLDIARDYGVGLSLACVQCVRPGYTVKGADPDRDELEDLLYSSLRGGAIGLKILGGHYPLTPEATARTIEVVNGNGAYIAFHVGTSATESNIEGLLEAVELAKGYPIHLAHINSYCRGRIRPYMAETEEAIAVLERNPNVFSESYLSPINGTSAKFSRGVLESKATEICLKAGGFDVSEQGMEEAIMAGWAQINMEAGGKTVLATGKRAVKWWRQKGTDTTVSFKMNPPEPRIRLVTAKRKTGEFVVDCISTDGGQIPRNVTVEMGLSLVRLQALSIDEFVIKTSRNPAQILGLKNKGHFSIGADADISVIDLDRQRPIMSLSGGNVIMFKGHVCGKGCRIITTPDGEAHIREKGLESTVIDPAVTPFCRR